MLDFRHIREKARTVAKRKWLQYSLREVSNNDNHVGLERIYRMTDPWSLDTPVEHERFEGTNREIEMRFGKVDSILEIGSGEGLQSTYLRQLCHSLYGVEVSGTAVERASARLPDAHFHVGDLAHQPWIKDGKRFDLVVACEVLYYMSDIHSTVRLMNRIGDACFISCFAPEAHKLSPIIDTMPHAQKSWLTRQGRTWLFAWWKNPTLASKARHAPKALLLWLIGCMNFATEALVTESALLMVI